ncbi:phospholipase D-like domain-containing protein [Tautonia sociabilis]|uniref:phospholipase D n=1 Tax=Tautonia sociabilis TaxID=2080755 RepID=A0A432MNJ4_9BACT|nr:phospholipase D-like domain-containing protein [Tautonia sociabilis]RUL89011.1 endonuclease [Tautonia sociabilis]
MADAARIDDLLSQTLSDFRFSRGERTLIDKVLDAQGADPGELALWRNRAFALARQAMAEGAGVEVIDWLEEVEKLLAHRGAESRAAAPESAAYFTPGDSGPRAIAWLFDRCRSTAEICVFTITDDRITAAILGAHRRGVSLRLITDDEKAHDTGSDIDRLRRAGVPTRTDRDPNHMHHKFAVFDRSTVLTGSYNWTRGAAEHNFENFITSGEPGLVAAFVREFERLWKAMS